MTMSYGFMLGIEDLENVGAGSGAIGELQGPGPFADQSFSIDLQGKWTSPIWWRVRLLRDEEVAIVECRVLDGHRIAVEGKWHVQLGPTGEGVVGRTCSPTLMVSVRYAQSPTG